MRLVEQRLAVFCGCGYDPVVMKTAGFLSPLLVVLLSLTVSSYAQTATASGEVDALVLSGGSPHVATDDGRMGHNGDYLDQADFPILGICAGMQFMCTHFGGSTEAAKQAEFGKATLYVEKEDELFAGLPKQFNVWDLFSQ